MGLKGLFYLCTLLVFAIQFFFNPILVGNERSRSKRAPIITILIVVVNVAVFAITLRSVEDQDSKIETSAQQLFQFLQQNPGFLLFTETQQKLKDAGLLEEGSNTVFGFSVDRPDDEQAKLLVGDQAGTLRIEFDQKIDDFKQARRSHIFYQFGIAPGGEWKPYQLLTSMFLHGGFWHLLGNMVFFCAIGLTLEALWGRSIFLGFYLLVGVAACIPEIILPASVPSLGASGAIAGIMGGFLVSLHKTKLKILWACLPLLLFAPLLLAHKIKPFGILLIPAYIFLPFYFVSQMLMWWFFKELGLFSGTAYSVHVGGFFFGVSLAVALEYVNLKTHFFGLEYNESLAAAEVKEFTEAGQVVLAEQKMQAFIRKHPDDINALTELGRIHGRMGKYDEMNDVFARVIRHHLSHGDKEAALYAYDALLSGFPEKQPLLPEKQVRPRIETSDWMTICDYLHKRGMVREAGVEYERLVDACRTSPQAVRACVQGGEAALASGDRDRARRMFSIALELNPSPAHEPRIRRGLERCDAQAGG
jgi:membrane associated rhomboid family serine protease